MDFRKDISEFQSKHDFSEINIDGIRFRYILCGSGPKTLTLLAGGMGLAELNFAFIEKLEAEYRILAFDYPIGLDTNAALCDGIHKLLRKLEIEKTVFIGESFGGYLAQIIARKYPDITEGICLFSTAGLNADTIESLKKKYSGMAKPLLWILGHIPYNWLKPLLIKASLRHMTRTTEEEYRYMKDFFTWAFRDYTGKFDVHMTSLLIDIMNQQPCRREEFAYLKGKVMLILPDDDGTFTPQMQADLISMFEDPYVVEHISGGHLSPILQTDKYAEKIIAFMNERIQ
jgi:pimeloyl-ACP methyl ester carboxylesterase